MLRLTLRTLLAYLDDTLEPSQAKEIGQKAADSEAARTLMERIKRVTRRRRLTTPPETGEGRIDANTIAEYLDSEVTPEQAAEVEQICLSSDVHLAEVASCHQILTLVLGEPISVPPTANQRMFRLVKGPESIPARKPAGNRAHESDEVTEPKDTDEALRLGVPALSKASNKSWLIVLAGGLAAACLLAVAIWQFMGTGDKPPTRAEVAQVVEEKNRPPVAEKTTPKNDPIQVIVVPPDSKTPLVPVEKEPKKDPELKPTPKVEMPVIAAAEVPFTAPDTKQKAIGTVASLDRKEAILLQMEPTKDWKRIEASKEVFSGRTLVSLPAARSQVTVGQSVLLTMWGTTPELASVLLFESMVELHASDVLDLDLTLLRGRIIVTSLREDRPVQVRIRFENPSSDVPEYVDVRLMTKNSEILVEHLSQMPRNEPFFKDAKNPARVGPNLDMAFWVTAGSANFHSGSATYSLSAPPAACLVLWNSVKKWGAPQSVQALPDFLKLDPPLPKGMDPRVRTDVVKSREMLGENLANKAVDVALAEALKSNNPASRRLVVRSFAALDDLPSLIDSLDQDKMEDLRLVAIDSLRNWISNSRYAEYDLFEQLKRKYKIAESETVMTLLHSFSEKEVTQPETYELLIDYLMSPNLAVRELAKFHLYILVPAGRGIPYSAAADAATRERSSAAWRMLVPPGRLPPPPPKGP